MSTPYWGQLPPPKASQARARRLSDDLSSPVDAPAQTGPPKSNRISVQTTKSDAPTESTMSPYASPTASSFQGQGLAPRPPSLPYGANQYPPELVENRRRRRSRNQEQDTEYAAMTGPNPPAAPDVPPTASARYPPQGAGRPSRQMENPVGRKEGRTRETLDESAMPRPQRVNTDPSLARNAALATNRGQRRSSAVEQSRQSSGARRDSTQSSTDRPRKLSEVRSPLQRLELTLDSISKEDKRARVEAAERAARERAAARETAEKGEKSPQQVRFRERRPSVAAADAPPKTPVTPSKPAQEPVPKPERAVPVQNDPLPQDPPAEAPRQIDAGGPSPRAAPESRIPVPVQPSGIPQRNLSFRERAARNDIKLPNGLDTTVPKESPIAGQDGRTPPRSGGNKLKKQPPNDAWPNRKHESEVVRSPGEVATRSPQVVVTGGHPTPATPRTANPSVQQPIVAAAARDPEELLDDDFEDEFMAYTPSAKPTRTASQRKADQILGRVPTQTGVANVPRQAVPPTATPGVTAYPPVATATTPRTGPDPVYQHHVEPSGEKHHVSDLVHHGRDQLQPGQGTFKPTTYLEEWKQATVGALTGGLLDLEEAPPPAAEKSTAWWEAPPSRRRSNSMSSRPKKAEAFEGEYDETNGTRSPSQQAIYPSSIQELQSGGPHLLSTSDVGGGLPYQPQHLAPVSKRAKARARRGDGLRPFSPSPSAISATSSQDSLGRFSLRSNDAAFSKQALSYSSPTRFKPPLYLKCGPLLRFCGIRQERVPSRSTRDGAALDREVWRGSIMIVTTDADSSYDIAPTLRLFAQPIELLPPPPREIHADEPLAPEYVDPIAGHPKLGRKGETLYVRPVDHLQEARDVSRDETDNGLFEKTKSLPDFPLPEGVEDLPGSFAARRKRAETDGEKAGKYKDVRGFRLHAERGYTFWRFNIEVELRDKQQRIAYRINRGPSTGFWVPARGQSMNIMFHSCNGFSMSVQPDAFSGPDPMWRDVLNTHQSQPFHVMIGGGDQIYNDRCMQDTRLFRDWLTIKNPVHKHHAPFTPALQDELERFYLERYAMWFSQGLFGMANAQIPMVNMWDDHDIIDGFGSYPHHFMNSPVFSGLGNVAFKYYMLFQHQSVVDETDKTEPSWVLGVQPGPYISELGRSLFMSLGGKVALLAVDARTERTRDEVVRDDTWKKIMDRCYGEIDKGKVEHLLVVLGVPIAYPRLVWLENLLTSRVMDPVKALAKMGMFGGLLNRFDGGVEVLDDLDDHWTAKNHKHERSIVVEDLQDLAADKSIRVSILSGDVHLAAIGQFYSNPKLGLAKHKDFRYMPNIISSAIVNTPPPDLLADVLNKRNKVHHFDKETDEAMIPIFGHGVDGKPRNNKHLLPHRNWCAIREYIPGHTPLPTPNHSAYDLTPLGSPPGTASGAGGEVVRRRNSLFRRLSRSRTTPGPDAIPRDRTRPPVAGGLLRSLSRRGAAASADEVGRPGAQAVTTRPGFLTRTLSGSSVSGRLGGLFRRRSSATRRDDGGINGVWGPESDEEEEERYYQQQQQQQQQQQHQQQQYPTPRGVGLRGGLGPDHYDQGYNDEFDQGDESYFSVKSRPGPGGAQPSQPSLPPTPPPKLGMGGGGGAAAAGPHNNNNPPQQQQQQQQQHPQLAPAPAPAPGPGAFHRTPTTLSARQRRRGAEQFAVDLQGALEVTLNVEISPRDPGGSTVPYRLVVPRLWYEYEGEDGGKGGGGNVGGGGVGMGQHHERHHHGGQHGGEHGGVEAVVGERAEEGGRGQAQAQTGKATLDRHELGPSQSQPQVYSQGQAQAYSQRQAQQQPQGYPQGQPHSQPQGYPPAYPPGHAQGYPQGYSQDSGSGPQWDGDGHGQGHHQPQVRFGGEERFPGYAPEEGLKRGKGGLGSIKRLISLRRKSDY